MWEDYLEQATHLIMNKYHKRRAQAKIRQQLLSIWADQIAQGTDRAQAAVMAMATLGNPEVMAVKLAEPLRQQRGWLWLVSVAQLLAGLGLLVASFRTESLADMAVGRVLTAWGFFSTSLNTFHHSGLRQNIVLAMRNVRFGLSRIAWAQGLVVMATAALSGALAAVLCSLPWVFVPNTVFHPVAVSDSLGLALFAMAAWGPWWLFRKRLVTAFREITWQIWASLTATAVYTILLVWNGQFVPPPFFNWQPELYVLGSFVSFFAALRIFAFFFSLKERIEPWRDDEIRSAI
ncbi:hypothetical protein [Sulfobacillus sp. hq2]|uniref:Uncharacterized protein n=1 Tax=Sulfobacillus thermotolerans TaxID=338644 RepID=A0ABN5H365_9FIRM|nr:hypothetical protein [Sulfobacillus sp. hq2]AUW95137.1 hypothetical protein BXT84_15225 [Sulfobacillus thermotolerans]POB10253.1 hypothetical protein CO251_09835 [Sulfobacillus sp. hq2]